MNNHGFIKRLRNLVLLPLGLAMVTGSSFAYDVYLVAKEVPKTLPGGIVVPMWGFAEDADGDLSTDGGETATVPGPLITIPPAETNLTIHVRNELTEPISLVIPGLITALSPVTFTDAQGRERVQSFTHETASGDTGIYTWSSRPGTFMYQSGAHPAVQVPMGLYGAVKQDAAPGEAYSTVIYDNEVILFYSDIDPALHEAVAGGTYGTAAYPSTINYKPQYFLINGSPYPLALPISDHIIAPNERVLIRFLNAGLKTYVPALQGPYMSVISEDGNLYPYPRVQYSVLLSAGKTTDVIFTPTTEDAYPIYDRRLHLTNGASSPGGMLTYLVVGGNDSDGDGIGDAVDNCSLTPNGPFLGTCVATGGDGVVSAYRVGGVLIPCDEDADCAANAGTCQLVQGDFNSNGCGDVCECLGDADNDGDVDGSDIFLLTQEFGRQDCSVQDPCSFDFSCDGDTDGSDVFILLINFGRQNCPSCVLECIY